MTRQAAVIIAGCLVGSQAILAAPAAVSKSDLPFRYNSKGRRDPFVPLVRDGQIISAAQSTPVEASKPVLHGILWDPGGQSIALINDAEVKVGNTIGDYQVTEIRHDAVVLSSGGETTVLQISFEAAPSSTPSGTTMGGEGQ